MRPVDPDFKGIEFPFHWATIPNRPRMVDLETASFEYKHIANRLKSDIGTGKIKQGNIKVQRYEDKERFISYDSARRGIKKNRGGDGNERWLWHGTDALESVLEGGFNSQAYASLSFNAYGAGNYFAPDAKLSDYFIRGSRGKAGEKKLILARVACGNIVEKEHLDRVARKTKKSMVDLLRQPENRKAPDGADSVTGAGKQTEVIIYRDTQAYAAYVVTYELQSELPDPYNQPRGYLKSQTDTAGWKMAP